MWRCVDIDDNGPLMLMDKVLGSMPYDAKTSENSATRSHSRNSFRSSYGSNHWRIAICVRGLTQMLMQAR